MDDHPPSKSPGFFERLFNRINSDAPETTEDVSQMLKEAYGQKVFNAETLQHLEKVLMFSDIEVRDIMISRSQMDVIKIGESLERIIAYVVDTAHSRFPVIGEDKDDIIGVLHAKDLLKFAGKPEHFQLDQILREPVFIPEGKPLNMLLKEFREQRNHMAMVVDEYGGTSGLVTFEDVIEQIIGDIEDEFDAEDVTNNIIAISEERFLVNAMTEIQEFNEFFKTDFSDEEADTIGGFVTQEFGHLPTRGEKITIKNMHFNITRADARRLHTIIVNAVK